MSFDMSTTINAAKGQETLSDALHEVFTQLAREIKNAAGTMYTVDSKTGLETRVKGADTSRMGEITSWLESQGAGVAASLAAAFPGAVKPSTLPFVAGGTPAKPVVQPTP